MITSGQTHRSVRTFGKLNHDHVKPVPWRCSKLKSLKRVSDVSAQYRFGPWAEPTVFATGEPGSVFALLGRINRVCVGRDDYRILNGKWGPWTLLRSLFSN